MADKKNLHAQVKLMVSATEDRKGPTFGKGAATLLHGIEENGSLNKTAKNLHMAYSKAWSMIKKVEEGLGFQLIERYGARGSKLTEDGEEFLKLYDVYDKKVEEFKEEGIQYTIRQIDEYRAMGVNGIHLYALNKWKDVSRIIDESGLCTLI